jgi:hypothetical protein
VASGLARLDPAHNFCALWSGARGFLGNGPVEQEVVIQLWQVFPCCPGTWFALGDARETSVDDILESVRRDPAFQALDRGDPAGLPVPGRSRAYAQERLQDLGSCCLWCDEFFRRHYAGPKGERRPFA